MSNYDPTPKMIEEHRARKAQYMAAKLGLIYLCENCRSEIYLPPEPKDDGLIHDCAMHLPKWLHVGPYGKHEYGRNPCYNDDSDGTAWPMNENGLRDLYDDIMKDDWWYEGREPEW